jgi:putative transposase
MPADGSMYYWRRLTPEQRREVLAERQRHHRPWHGPPHFASDSGLYLMTAACYEHRPIIGHSAQRMAEFEAELLTTSAAFAPSIFAWIVLPNHYHLLLQSTDLKALLAALGQLHGRTSHRWNGFDGTRGRKVWYRAVETAMKSERHFWATLNYVLNNAVRHGYVERWQDWPYSNAAAYLEETGRQEAERRWRKYPIDDYGRDWDPPEL